jgi:hypothetical protein
MAEVSFTRVINTHASFDVDHYAGFVTSPQLPPSSSPIASCEMMEMSPVPQKAVCIVQVEVHSPTPVPTPEDIMVESPVDIDACQEAPKPVLE